MAGYGRQYFGHTVLAVGAAVLNGILFYVLRIVLYDRLGQEDYGIFYGIYAFGSLMYPLIAFGFDPGLTTQITRFREDGKSADIKSLVLSALVPQGLLAGVLLLVAFVFAPQLAVYCFDAPGAALLMRVVALHALLFLLFKTGFMVLLGLQFAASRNLAELTRGVFILAAAVLLLKRGLGPAAAAYAYVIGTGVGTLVEVAAMVMLRPDIARGKAAWRPDLVGAVFRPGTLLSLAFGGVILFSQLDTVMISLVLRDKVAVAAYQIAVPTMMIVHALLLAGVSNFMPMVTTLWHRGERDLLGDGIGRIYEAGVVLILPGTALLACFSDVLMSGLFPRGILNAPEAFNVLAVGSVFFFICALNLHILAGIGQTRGAAWSTSVALVLNIGLNLVLIHFFGIRGAAFATVASHSLAAAIGYAWIRRSVPVHLRLATVAAAVAVSALAAGACVFLRRTGLFAEHPRLVALAAAGLLYPIMVTTLELAGMARLRELIRVVLLRKTGVE
jgi:O-antigen/teichoic acid export membrane protein